MIHKGWRVVKPQFNQSISPPLQNKQIIRCAYGSQWVLRIRVVSLWQLCDISTPVQEPKCNIKYVISDFFII